MKKKKITIYDDYNSRIRRDQNTLGTITCQVGHSAIRSSYKLIERSYMEKEDEKVNIRIRKLTPRECWRLMGFNDEQFDKAQEVNSDSQLYKQAGNSIVVDVLEDIFKEMM